VRNIYWTVSDEAVSRQHPVGRRGHPPAKAARLVDFDTSFNADRTVQVISALDYRW
jgi:hypothetical protein